MDYDFEWYNGMNLAGLWAYDYFSEGSESTRFIKKHWALISDIFAYAKGYADWANLLAWTCARGESTWLDGINYMYEGTLGYAALARKLGRADDAAWGDYCAAKLEAFVCNCWLAGPYYREHFPQREDVEPVCASGYWEGRPVSYHDQTGWSCGNYGYCVRELLVLFKDLKLEDKLRRSLAGFERNFPDWRENAYAIGKKEGYPGFDQRRTIHHYFLDPRLMVSAVVLGEDVDGLM